MPNDKTPILVTGGAGYIGSHTCKALAQAGYLPVVYDNLSRGHASAVRYGPLAVGDIQDGEHLRDVIRKHRPAGVVHFAALIEVADSVRDPLSFYRNNVGGTVTLLQAMQAEGVRNIVFSSTCATYGTPRSNPITEDMPQAPINPYGHSKLMVERILRDCAGTGAISAVALRYFNAAGADPDGEIGERHDPETHLIPLALGAAHGTRPALTVFGTDHPTPDGTCVRDYIHVCDLAEAHVRALGITGSNTGFEAFNLGTGTGVSIRELLDAVERVTGRSVPHSFGARRPGDAAALIADPGRARQLLNWTPAQSDLDTILRTAWGWITR